MFVSFHPSKKSSSGFGFLELLLAIAVLSFILASIIGFNVQMSKLSAADSVQTAVEVVRRRIIVSVIDPSGWAFTYNANSNMTCLKNNMTVPCLDGGAPIANQPLALYDGSGTLVYDGRSPSEGFTPWGVRCTTYNANNATQSCYFHYDLIWGASCAVANCMNPVVVVSATLSVAANAPFSFNPSFYSIPATYRMAQ